MRIKFLMILILLVSCAGARVLVPKLEKRTLWISKDRPGVYYDYCKDYSIFGKCKKWQTDFYDFNNKEQRMKLKNMGFKLRVIRR